MQPEVMSAKRGSAAAHETRYENFLGQHYPHILQDNRERARREEQGRRLRAEAREAAPAFTEERAPGGVGCRPEQPQMPAVAGGSQGGLAKTIEHYTFADDENMVSFSICFDRDLWDGASKYITDGQVKVESKASSLEIRLRDVPVSDRASESLAEWRLTLSPLFAHVEPSMTRHKVRNGRLSVKLVKTRSGSWKKGVKY